MKPKYSIIIQDLSADQVRRVVNEMDSGDFFVGASMSARQDVSTPVQIEQPVAPINVVAPVTNGVEVDSSGMPWDERIHASTKATNKDGTWKQRRGVQPIVLEQVTAELKGQTVAVAPVVPVAAPLQVPVAAPVAAPAPIAPPAPVAPVQIERNYAGLMTKIGEFFRDGAVQPVYPQTIIQRINEGFKSNVNSLTDIMNDPAKVEYAWQCIEVDQQAGIIGKK